MRRATIDDVIASCTLLQNEALWEKCAFHFCELTEVFRQSDKHFVDLLHRCRTQECIPSDIATLRACTSMLDMKGSVIVPTKLYPLNKSVDSENERNFAALAGTVGGNPPLVKYYAVDDANAEGACNRRHRISIDCCTALCCAGALEFWSLLIAAYASYYMCPGVCMNTSRDLCILSPSLQRPRL